LIFDEAMGNHEPFLVGGAPFPKPLSFLPYRQDLARILELQPLCSSTKRVVRQTLAKLEALLASREAECDWSEDDDDDDASGATASLEGPAMPEDSRPNPQETEGDGVPQTQGEGSMGETHSGEGYVPEPDLSEEAPVERAAPRGLITPDGLRMDLGKGFEGDETTTLTRPTTPAAGLDESSSINSGEPEDGVVGKGPGGKGARDKARGGTNKRGSGGQGRNKRTPGPGPDGAEGSGEAVPVIDAPAEGTATPDGPRTDEEGAVGEGYVDVIIPARPVMPERGVSPG
jgi:hypothetical protein